MDRHAKNKKRLMIRIVDSLYDDFKTKLDFDNIEIQEMLESAIYAYLYGNSQKKTKSNKTIDVSINVK